MNIIDNIYKPEKPYDSLGLIGFCIRQPKLVIFFHIIALLVAVSILAITFQPVFTKADPRDSKWQTIINGLFDNSIHSIVGQKGAGSVEHRRFQKQFGSDEFIQLVASHKGSLNADTLNQITRFVSQMEQTENNAQVIWLGKLPHAPDELKFNQPIVASHNNVQLSNFLERVEKDPLAHRLIQKSASRWDMALYVIPQKKLKNDGDRARFTRLVETIWKNTTPSDWKTGIVGTPKILDQLRQSLVNAVIINFPLVNLLVIGLCWLVARQLSIVLIFFVPLLQSEIWMTAAYLGSGYKFNYITGNMATVIMIVGAATSIHLLSAWVRERSKYNVNDATKKSFQHIYRPCLVATSTTIIALLSLGLSSAPAIQSFGMFSAFGLIATLICSFTLIPALLAIWPNPKPVKYRPDWLSAPLMPLPYWAWKNPKKVLIGAFLLFVFSLFGLTQLKVGTHIHGYFSNNSDYRKAVDFAQKRFPGYIPYELIISWPESKSTIDLEKSSSIINLSRQLKKTILTSSKGVPFFTSRDVLSLADFLTSFCLNPEKKSVCPEGKAKPELERYFIESGLSSGLSPYIIKDGNQFILRTTIFHNPGYASDNLKMMQNLTQLIQKQIGITVKVTITGIATLWVYHDATIIRSMVNSFISASFIILIMMSLFFRQARPLLISIPVNIIPLMLSLSIAGIHCMLFSAKLTTAALMFTTVGVGIIVDDTLYFMLTYQKHIKHGQKGSSALNKTVSILGPGIILTAICLAAGTATLMAGELIPMKVFGGMLSLTVIFALFADLLILPALCRLFWNPHI